MTGDGYYRAADEAAAFMRNRLDELEKAARAAVAGTRRRGRPASGRWVLSPEDPPLLSDEGSEETIASGDPPGSGVLAHIARNDPAAVLASVAADRALLSAYEQARNIAQPDDRDHGYLEAAADTIHTRAAVWNEHPGYQQAWKP